MRQHTIEVFLPPRGVLKKPLVLFDKDTYDWRRAHKFTQHQVFFFPSGEIHVCCEGGKLSVEQAEALIRAWFSGETVSIDVNTGVSTYQRRENGSP